MKYFQSIGLMLVSGLALLGSCTKENVMADSLQVTNQEVSITCFEKSMVDIDEVVHSRANSPTSLKNAHSFNELEVALIPIDEEEDSGYVIRQDSTMADFGKVQLNVPAGTYHLIAVAANSKNLQKGRITIQNYTTVTFPNNQPTDMVYAYKEITVNTNKSKQNFDATLVRGISCFVLTSSETTPADVAKETITINGNCGTVFNPVTGKCAEKCEVSRTSIFDGSKFSDTYLHFAVYVVLGEDDVSDLQVDAQAYDKNDKVIRKLHFDNVHLEKAKATRYKGAIFSSTNTANFTVSMPKMEDSEYSKDF